MPEYVKVCPQCGSERPAEESLCEGQFLGGPCGWVLTGELVSLAGQVRGNAPAQSSSVALAICPNGHPLGPGDQVCFICGATSQAQPSGAVAAELPSEIDGWRVVERHPDTTDAWERFAVENATGRAVLTHYKSGSEPDPGVHDVLRRMDRDHIPELLATGRLNGRAYEITELIRGSSLRDSQLHYDDSKVVSRIVDELSRALAGFAEVGLRHRDLTPDTVLVRSSSPLDLVVTGFGSARLSDFDLESVAPLRLSRYSSPESIVGGVAAASDWWSLGMIVLEGVTHGDCFKGINDKAFLIHIVTRGASVPRSVEPNVRVLLVGLLARDPLQRWGAKEVSLWLGGESVLTQAEAASDGESDSGPRLALQGVAYTRPENYALAAAEAENWPAALEMFLQGALATWLDQRKTDPTIVANVRRLAADDQLAEPYRHALALMVMNPALPLTIAGEIVTPAWLLAHPEDGYALIAGPVSRNLERMGRERWLVALAARAARVRERARLLEIELDETRFRVAALATSRSNLDVERVSLRRIYPDSEHRGLSSLLEHDQLQDDDLIALVSANPAQFTPIATLVDSTKRLADQSTGKPIEDASCVALFIRNRREIYAEVDARIVGFAKCSAERVNEWADSFRVERRISLPRAAILLAIPASDWAKPPRQEYVALLLDHFEKRVVRSVQQGPLMRFIIGKTTPRVDLYDLGTALRPAEAILDQIVRRSAAPIALDPSAFLEKPELLSRLRRLSSHALTFQRDTGIDGRYLAFPFLLVRDGRVASPTSKPKFVPVLLWPIELKLPAGSMGNGSLGFDAIREEVRLNPALEGILGADAIVAWREAREQLLSRATLRITDIMDVFGTLAAVSERQLKRLASQDNSLPQNQRLLVCAAALFNAEFTGQAISEDLRELRRLSPSGTGLEAALRVRNETTATREARRLTPNDQYFAVESDPSQELGIAIAREAPGLVLEGPPGTGKSQTIVNIVADCIARGERVLVVCQKQAALRVVEKRLEAEGLASRITSIIDAIRDREPIVRDLRDQIARVRAQPRGLARLLQSDRDEAAARSSVLESELDSHHEALYADDKISGMTYRDVLAALISLEASWRPINVSPLRQRLQKVTRARVAQLEETCGPLSPLWLEARFEGSPLAALSQFAGDLDLTEKLKADVTALKAAEARRSEVMTKGPSDFELSEVEPLEAWIAEFETLFAELTDEQRQTFARWFSSFKPEPSVSTAPSGIQAIQRLTASISALRALENSKVSADMLRELCAVPILDIREWLTLVTQATAHVSFFRRFSIFRWLARHRARAILKRPNYARLTQSLQTFGEALDLENTIRPFRKMVESIRGDFLPSETTPLISARTIASQAEMLRAKLESAKAQVDALMACPARIQAERMAKAGTNQAYMAFRRDLQVAIERHIVRRAALAAIDPLVDTFTPEWIEESRQRINANLATIPELEAILSDLQHLPAFQKFRARATHLAPDVLATFANLRRLEPTLLTVPIRDVDRTVRNIIRREALLGWKTRLENDLPALLQPPDEIVGRSSSLASAELDLRVKNKAFLRDNIDASRLGSQQDWDSITRLRGPRAKRLRELFDLGIDLGLGHLRPVWLMTPDTVSRVLPRRPGLFDTVVFDEASQMLVEHAVPSLYRAKRVVICGDEKQMPPTSFFSSRSQVDDEEFEGGDLEDSASDTERATHEENWNRREIKDCPDLLSLGRDSLPPSTLKIHYRSKYRELIAYSNAAFYKGELSIPARHPAPEVKRVKPIEVVRVDGTYEEQTNPAEANRVVTILADLWRSGVVSPSIGVVTFNRKQADLIEEAIQKRASEDVLFRSSLDREQVRLQQGEDMSFFVKNLENVQGDERDVIIFSTTFGRDKAGSFKRFFGVLGQTGGERRLNVAVTRARDKVILVTSIPINDVSDMLAVMRPPTTPRDYLQGYLDYATKISRGELDLAHHSLQRMSARSPGGGEASKIDGFVEAVAAYVTQLGHLPVLANDGDAFGIDLAIPDPRTGEYGLGIECDSPRDKGGHLLSARAREIWRPAVLRRSIPVIHRVSSQGWYEAGDVERHKLAIVIATSLGSTT